jgi:hypothetical protein
MKPGYEKHMDMPKFYIQYKVADLEGENISKFKKEIEDAFEKVVKVYSDQELIMRKDSLKYDKI